MQLQALLVAALPPAECRAGADAASVSETSLSEGPWLDAGSCRSSAWGTGTAAPAVSAPRCPGAVPGSAAGARRPCAAPSCSAPEPGTGGATPCAQGAGAPAGSHAAGATEQAPGRAGAGYCAAGAAPAYSGRLRAGLRGGDGCEALPAHADVVAEFGLFGTDGSCTSQVGMTAGHPGQCASADTESMRARMSGLAMRFLAQL